MLQTEDENTPTHILGQWMSVSALQKAVTSAGICIFTNEHSDKYVSVNAKVRPHLVHTQSNQTASHNLYSKKSCLESLSESNSQSLFFQNTEGKG